MADILGFPHGTRPGDAYTTPQHEVNPNESRPEPERGKVLQEAYSLICDVRHDQHGEAKVNLGLTGDLWTLYSGRKLSAHDVALMNVLQKISRILAGHHNRDNYVDLAGYAALAYELLEK